MTSDRCRGFGWLATRHLVRQLSSWSRRAKRYRWQSFALPFRWMDSSWFFRTPFLYMFGSVSTLL